MFLKDDPSLIIIEIMIMELTGRKNHPSVTLNRLRHDTRLGKVMWFLSFYFPSRNDMICLSSRDFLKVISCYLYQ